MDRTNKELLTKVIYSILVQPGAVENKMETLFFEEKDKDMCN